MALFFTKLIKSDRFNLFLIFFSTLVIYIHHLSPSIYGGDSGDLLSAAIVKGVAHPSGYPLYTILGILFLKLPIEETPAWKFGLSSAILSSFSVVLMYLIVKEITENRLLALSSAITLAFSFPFWIYAEIVEVFALHNFFILIITFLTIKYLNTLNKKFLFALSFFVGLSLTNNLVIILLIPTVLITIFIANKKIVSDFKTLLACFTLTLLALIPYLYVPWAATKNPPINWDKVVNLENLFYLIARKDYGWGISNIISEGFDYLNANINLETYARYWFAYLNFFLPVTIPFGFWQLIKRKKFALLFLLSLGLFLLGPFFIYYSRNKISSYAAIGIMEKFYTGSIIFVLILFPLGIELLTEFVIKNVKNLYFKKVSVLAITTIVAIIPASFFITNFKKTNLSKIYVGENLGLDLLTPLPKDAILVLSDDSKAFSSIYAQVGLGIRKDVSIPGNYEGYHVYLRAEGWKEKEIEKYLVKYKNSVDRNLLLAILPKLIEKESVYTDYPFEIYDINYGRIVSVPYGLLYKLEFEKNLEKLTKENYVSEVKRIVDSYHLEHIIREGDLISEHLYLAHIRRWYALGFLDVARFIKARFGEEQLSQKFIEKAREIDPILNI